MPASFVYGQVTVDFKVRGKVEKATFKYKYYSESNSVEYVAVECSDPALREKMRDDPAVRRQVDEYVRKQLSKRNEGLS
ncbi:MAG: hypothetical protein ABI347_08610 [Nitrososphaera sp.]